MTELLFPNWIMAEPPSIQDLVATVVMGICTLGVFVAAVRMILKSK